MRFEEMIKTMIRSYFVITTGIVVSMYVYCLICNPNVNFSLDDIGRILIMAGASDLPYVIFLSRRELGKKQMLIRKIIHLLVLSAVLLYFASVWDWVALNNAKQVEVFLLCVLAVYAIVCLTIKFRDKKLTDKINNRLKERYHS